MPDPIVALSRRFLHHPVTIHAGHTTESGPSPLTKQVVYRTHPLNKLEMVARILQARGRGLTMIFCRTKRAADRVAEDLDFRGFAVAAVHGDLGQGARERALRAFRSGKIDVLVATDVAARGLDVSGVTHVLNYDCPEDPDTYTHRIGRTGRAGATGVAVTFVDWEDMPRWVLIDKSMGLNMPQPPETYHTSTALYSDLDIPADISGTLPTADRNRVGLSAEIEEDLGGGRRRREPAGGARGRRPRTSGPSSAPASSPAAGPSDDENDRPKRQRRRRKVADSSPVTEATATEAGAPAAASSALTSSDVDVEQPVRTRSRRRTAAATMPLFSVGVEDSADAGSATAPTASADDSPGETAGSAGSGPASPDDGDEGDRPRRRRRRGGRGRGAGSGSDDAPAEMTGGSEAGVGTTA
jgi:superfamily II DNA/RNA helicase